MKHVLAGSLIALLCACQSSGEAEGMAAGLQQENLPTHPFSIQDMLAMQRVSGAQVSPNGEWIVFVLRSTDVAANRGRSDLWLAAADGSATRQLTSDPGSDFEPRWMPDGRSIAFLSTRSGSVQVWEVDVDGGTQRLSDFPVDVTGMRVFPDGRRFALSMEVHPDAASLMASAARDAAPAPKSSAMAFESLLFRHWDTWEDGKRSHVFVWDPGAGGEPLDLMRGMDADCPTRPFGGSEDFAVAPDGSRVVMAFKDDGVRASWTTNVDLWIAASDASVLPRRITAGNEALDGHPVFSPDGSILAHLAMSRPGYEADKQDIVLLDVENGVRDVITARWDRSATEIAWSADGNTLYTSAADLGNHSIFAIDVATREVTRLVSDGTNRGVLTAGERLVFSHDDLTSPVELHSVTLDEDLEIAPITSINARRVAMARMGDYEQFTFPGAGGESVHGYVVKPADFVSGRKYPVAFLIHGGPQGSFGNHFHYRWNPQAYAGAGYAAVFIDFHGSTGYGQEFTDSINQDWGGKPYEDLMLGLDQALHLYPFLDGNRVAALGASYGGYMINWIAGQTDRFRCLVNHDGVFDARALYFATEEQWFPEWDFGGAPWENPEAYRLWNPVEYVQNWNTPMLVIQGALDFRVVETQAFAAFTALQRQGVPSRLLYFPDENHWVLKPQNSIRWHEEVLAWLDRWTAPEPEPAQ